MTKIAVIGGGIAGLGVGLFAQKNAQNLELTVFEKHERLETEDNLLWLAPNGLHLLSELGLLGVLRERSVPQTAMCFANRKLETLSFLDCDKLERSNGHPLLAVKRRDLYQLLLDRFLEQGGKLMSGHALIGLKQSQDEVTLSFHKHAAPHAYDYVIGADGIGSTTRRFVFPESYVQYAGIRLFLGHSVTPLAAQFVGKTVEVWGVGTRLMLASLDGRTAYWSAMERTPTYEPNATPVPRDVVQRLGAAFKDYHPDVATILAAAVPSGIHRSNFGFVAGLSRYAQGRVCLIGDAAHGMPPNMGQGASLALEDAYCLIESLRHVRQADHGPLALQRQADLRRKRAHQMVQIAKSMNTLFQPKSRLASLVRDRAAAMFPQSLTQRRMARLYALPFPLEGH